jgi:hypothetical protein
VWGHVPVVGRVFLDVWGRLVLGAIFAGILGASISGKGTSKVGS